MRFWAVYVCFVPIVGIRVAFYMFSDPVMCLSECISRLWDIAFSITSHSLSLFHKHIRVIYDPVV